jgi:hypothetical protein
VIDDGDRRRPTTDDRRASFALLKPCPRGPPVRAAKRTNWHTLDGDARGEESTNTYEASSSRYRSFEPAVRGTGDRRRRSTTVIDDGD